MPARQLTSPVTSAPGRKVPRVLAALLLGFQALMWGGGSIADARTAAESLSRHSHVEDQGSTTCPPIHSHLDCLICRSLSGGASGGSAPACVQIRSDGFDRPPLVAVAPEYQGRFGFLGSRAPPGA